MKNNNNQDPFKDVNPNEVPYEESGGRRQAPVTALVPLTDTASMDEEEKETWTEVVASTLMGHDFLRRNWGMVALIIALAAVYVSNRYMADQEMIRINDLQRELDEVRYRALTHSSELTMQCRLSFVEEALRLAGDTTLAAPTEPPFIINANTPVE